MLEVFTDETWKLLRWVLTRVGERDVAAVRRREAHPIITTTHTSLSHRPIPGLTDNNVPTSPNCNVNPFGARESWGGLVGVMCDSIEAYYWRNQSFMTCSKRFVNNMLQWYDT